MRKTINFFIASSAELKRERMELVDLMQDMNEDLEEQGLKLKPVLWEYMDSSMRAGRKEDEYLEKLRDCEICIVLFWQILGEYTVEELDVAIKEMRLGRYPKDVHVLFKETAGNPSEEFISFKENFYNKYQLYPETFNNISSLRKQIDGILHTFINKNKDT